MPETEQLPASVLPEPFAGSSLVRINLGCGSTPTPGWLNFDNSPLCRLAVWPSGLRLLSPYLGKHRRDFVSAIERREVRYADVMKRIPLPDESVAAVYASHMFDQLPLNKHAKFFREVLRVLAPGGYIRLATTDLQVIVNRYAGGEVDADQFVRMSLLAADTGQTILQRINYLVFGPRGYRRWIYDGPSLAACLLKFGFTDIIIMPAGKTTIPDPGALLLDERASETVYVEGRKSV